MVDWRIFLYLNERKQLCVRGEAEKNHCGNSLQGT
jgi:hypothetical protein